MIQRKKTERAGFTLLELVVVAGIFSAISFIIAQVFFTTIRTNKKTETYRDVKQNGDQTLDIIVRMIQNAVAVSASSCPDASTDPESVDTLSLTLPDGGTTTLSCDESVSGYPRIASSSGGKRIFLTNENVSIFDTVTNARDCLNNALSFTCTSVGSTPATVHVKFSLVQKNAQALSYDSAKETFETTVTLRNK